MAIVSAVVVTGTVVLVFRIGGAPSASDSGNLTRVRSATDCDCVVVPDAVSRFDAAGAAVATVSGSSGGFDLHSWNRSHQDRFTVTSNFQRSSSSDWVSVSTDPRSLHSGESHPNVVSPLDASVHDCEPCHSVYRSNAHLFCCHVRAKCLRAMRIPIC